MLLEGLPVHHALAMGLWQNKAAGPGILCAGLPVRVVQYAPFRPLALVMLLLPWYFHYLYLFSHFYCYFPFYRVAVHLPRKWPTYEIQSFAS